MAENICGENQTCSTCPSSGNCSIERERASLLVPQSSFNNVRHVLAVLSGKGGVGKSSLTGLLAIGLAKEGYRVGILDADITGPSIPKIFGLTARPKQNEHGLLPVETTLGIKVMSLNLLLPEETEPVIWRGPLISSAIKQFWTEVVWGDLDYLVVDLPPGTGDATLTVMQSLPIDGIVMVSSPQELAVMIVTKALRMSEKMGVPLLGLVENMSYALCPHCGEQIRLFGPSKVEETAAQTGLDLLAVLPLDPQLAELCDAGKIEEYGALPLNMVQELTKRINAKEVSS
ncbi:MAG: Mrp/NBP35 family ATP-binding protein [Bacillota bacterium]